MNQTTKMAKLLLVIYFFAVTVFVQSAIYAQNSSEQSLALTRLNSFLSTFAGGHYGSAEVTNGTFFIRYKSGHSSNFKIGDISEIKIVENTATKTRVSFICRDNQKCVYSGNTYSHYETQPFATNGAADANELFSLMDNVLKAFKTVDPQTIKAPAERSAPTALAKDTDGDGVIESLDGCPLVKGTVANGGCPEKDDDALTAAEIKQQKEALDSLKSNVEFGRPASPAPTPTPVPAVNNTSILPNSDCSEIVAGKGCGKLALGASESEIEAMLGKPDAVAEGNHRYFAAGIVIRYTADRTVEQISFIRDSPYRGTMYKPFAGNPGRNVAWLAGVQQIKAIYGSPQEHWDSRNLAGVKIDWLTYPNIKFELFEGTLREVVVGNFFRTAAEIAAANKPVEGPLKTKADLIVAEYKTMHDRLERNMSEYNHLASKYAGEMRLHLSGSAFKTREAMSRIAAESLNSIDAFLKKHDGFLAQSIKDHLLEDKDKFLDRPAR